MNGKCDVCGKVTVGKESGGHNHNREFEYCEEHMPPKEDE